MIRSHRWLTSPQRSRSTCDTKLPPCSYQIYFKVHSFGSSEKFISFRRFKGAPSGLRGNDRDLAAPPLLCISTRWIYWFLQGTACLERKNHGRKQNVSGSDVFTLIGATVQSSTNQLILWSADLSGKSSKRDHSSSFSIKFSELMRPVLWHLNEKFFF